MCSNREGASGRGWLNLAGEMEPHMVRGGVHIPTLNLTEHAEMEYTKMSILCKWGELINGRTPLWPTKGPGYKGHHTSEGPMNGGTEDQRVVCYVSSTHSDGSRSSDEV